MAERVGSTGRTVLPGVVDHHVHLGLVDRELLADGPLVEVHDLGWDPVEAAAFRAHPPAGVRVRIAGPFHTAPGGYPSGRPWAPRGSVRELADSGDAKEAVATAVRRRYDAVKVVLHTGLPLLADEPLRALVAAAHDAGLTVAVHAEGRGQTARAVDAGADVLVHAPWTERVADDVLHRGRHMTWVSTLAIHGPAERAVALDNLRRFRAVGGRVVYGTDLGNGPTPAGVVADEIRALEGAGLTGDDLLDAVLGGPGRPVALAADLPRPSTAAELVAWLAAARRLPSGEDAS